MALLPLTARAWSAKLIVRFLPHAALYAVALHDAVPVYSMLSSAGQLATTGAALSITVMVWLQVVELLCASVAVQVRLVLLAWLPLTARAWSAKLTVRLLSHASLKAAVPNCGVAWHSMGS